MIRKIWQGVEYLRKSAKQPLQFLFSLEARLAARWASSAHRRLMYSQWNIPPQPEHFDHTIDLYFQWRKTRNSLWVERGVFGGLALTGGDVLELACGDGFNATNFYSLRSKTVVACDFDPSAIYTASKNNNAENVKFLLGDIRTNMPVGRFDVIIWDAAIEHFTPEEISGILAGIKNRLAKGGVLSGYTLAASGQGKALSHHEHEFGTKEELANFLSQHFNNIKVFETIYPSRHNFYFWASDGVLPFDQDWPNMVVARAPTT